MAGAEERAKWAQYYIENGFSGLEKLLHGHAGKYCFGDNFTMVNKMIWVSKILCKVLFLSSFTPQIISFNCKR
jgi:glutathione S-transferase